MSTIKFTVGDTYPNLSGQAEWEGSVPLTGMTGVMVANGETEGQFTGELVLTNPTEGADKTTIDWSFDVQPADTEKVGRFKLCIRLNHVPEGPETINLNTAAEVVECG